jgi:Pentapeptide repeats (9 copies)/Pentapeptide repeats (8 copies)
MNHRLSVCYVLLIQLGMISAASAYNPADLKVLMATNKCVGCDLSGADLSRKQLANADLQAANLVGANLAGTNLTGAKLGGANLTGANFTSTNLTDAVLQAASLIDVNFASTNLTRTDFSYANLVNTNFRTAILSKTDLAGANLALADFTGVNLGNVSLTSANLTTARGISPSSPVRIIQPGDVDGNNNSIRQDRPRNSPAAIPGEESSPTMQRRPRVYRIPSGLGSPQRLVPGGTRQSAPPDFWNK